MDKFVLDGLIEFKGSLRGLRENLRHLQEDEYEGDGDGDDGDGSVVGIVVGSVLGVLGLTCLSFLWYAMYKVEMKRLQRKKEKETQIHFTAADGNKPVEPIKAQKTELEEENSKKEVTEVKPSTSAQKSKKDDSTQLEKDLGIPMSPGPAQMEADAPASATGATNTRTITDSPSGGDFPEELFRMPSI